MARSHGSPQSTRHRPRLAGRCKAVEHQGRLDQLKSLSGREFDVAYDKIQMDAHSHAVSPFESYAQGGDDPQLKQWAATTLTALKMHKSMADRLH